MRILQIGNFDRSNNYRAFYNCDYRLFNGLVRSGHHVMRFSDRDMARESTPFKRKKFGIKKANKRLLEVCENFQPEFVLLGHVDVISIETLRVIKEKYTPKIAQYNVDPLFADKNIRSINSRLEVCDATFTTTAGDLLKQFEVGGKISAFIPNPVDISVFSEKNFEKTEFEYDVCFLGAGTYRENIMKYLTESLPDIRFSIHGVMGYPKVFGMAFQRVLANSCMGLNLSHAVEDLSEGQEDFCQNVKDFEKHKRVDKACYPYLYSSDRISQLMGSGQLVFGTNATGLKDMFTEDEMVYFETNEELAERIVYYRENDEERRRIAKNGWLKSQHYTSEKIVQYMIDVTMGREEAFTKRWLEV